MAWCLGCGGGAGESLGCDGREEDYGHELRGEGGGMGRSCMVVSCWRGGALLLCEVECVQAWEGGVGVHSVSIARSSAVAAEENMRR